MVCRPGVECGEHFQVLSSGRFVLETLGLQRGSGAAVEVSRGLLAKGVSPNGGSGFEMASESGNEMALALETTGLSDVQKLVIADPQKFAGFMEFDLSNERCRADAEFHFTGL